VNGREDEGRIEDDREIEKEGKPTTVRKLINAELYSQTKGQSLLSMRRFFTTFFHMMNIKIHLSQQMKKMISMCLFFPSPRASKPTGDTPGTNLPTMPFCVTRGQR
jgi:hypothetical protein